MVEFKFEYKGRKVGGKGEPFVDSEFFYITADPALEDSKIRRAYKIRDYQFRITS